MQLEQRKRPLKQLFHNLPQLDETLEYLEMHRPGGYNLSSSQADILLPFPGPET